MRTSNKNANYLIASLIVLIIIIIPLAIGGYLLSYIYNDYQSAKNPIVPLNNIVNNRLVKISNKIMDNLGDMNVTCNTTKSIIDKLKSDKTANQNIVNAISGNNTNLQKNIQDTLNDINNMLLPKIISIQTLVNNLNNVTQYTTDANMKAWVSTQVGAPLANVLTNTSTIVNNNLISYVTTQINFNSIQPIIATILNNNSSCNQYINNMKFTMSSIYQIQTSTDLSALVKLEINKSINDLSANLNTLQNYNNNIEIEISNFQNLQKQCNQIINNEYNAIVQINSLNQQLSKLQDVFIKSQSTAANESQSNAVNVITANATNLSNNNQQLIMGIEQCLVSNNTTDCIKQLLENTKSIPLKTSDTQLSTTPVKQNTNVYTPLNITPGVKFTNKSKRFIGNRNAIFNGFESNTFNHNQYENIVKPTDFTKSSTNVLEGFNMLKSVENMFSYNEGFKSIRVGAHDFKVHEDLSDPKAAAELMARLNKTAKRIIYNLNDKFINNPNGLALIKPEFKDRVHDGIIALTKNYTTPSLEENIPSRSGGDTSYVVNKGDTFAMCLRDPNNNNSLIQSYNELVFVLVHEMAHLFTSTFGHDFMFWANFNFILREATNAKMYTVVNYKADKQPYCGIQITYSPIFDTELPNYYL